MPSSSTRRTALALNSSVNWRRARRFGVSAIGLDIVFPFGKMSTKPDQVHPSRDLASVIHDQDVVAQFLRLGEDLRRQHDGSSVGGLLPQHRHHGTLENRVHAG